MRARWLFFLPLLLSFTGISFAQQWYSIQTNHVIAYSDGNDHGARDAVLHTEQLAAVFQEIFHRKMVSFAVPLRVIVQSSGSGSATLVRTPLANFVSINSGQPNNSWPQAATIISSLILENNYPRAQPWFDSGIASYMAAVRFTGDQMELGAPPPGLVLPSPATWIPLAKILDASVSPTSALTRATFDAESWALVRWLIDNSRMAQAGAYLNAVQSRGATPERALAEAFSMSFADLDREVRESLANLSGKKTAAPRVESNLFKSQKISAADAHVLLANLSLFGPEGDRTLHDLVQFMRQNQDNAAVHRSLAWAFLIRGDQDNAVEHIRRALALDDSDPTMHYLYARWVNHGEDDKIVIESADVRIGYELKEALKREPNYPAALELMGLAQLSGDTPKSALANLQRASELCPRNSRYYFNLARAYESQGNLDTARNLYLYAQAGDDASVHKDATESLEQLGKQKKRQQQWAAMGLQADPNAKHTKYDNLQDAIAEEEKEEAQSKNSASPAADARKIENLKGRIIDVECADGPGATITVNSAGRVWKMHAADRSAIVLLGVDHFDCGWQDKAASINYKRSGNLQGDLVSLEAN